MASNPQQGIPDPKNFPKKKKSVPNAPDNKPSNNPSNIYNNANNNPGKKNKKGKNQDGQTNNNQQNPVQKTSNPSTSSNMKTEQVLKEVMDALDCPICLEFLKSPIFMCESGHDICGNCRAALALPICPLCKTTVTNQRNFRLEAIVEKMATPCVNSKFGCNFMGSADQVKSHFKECTFQQIFCPLGKEFKQCLWNGNLSNLYLHFTEAHPSNVVLKPAHQVLFDNFDITKPDENIQLIGLGKTLYLYHVKIDPFKNVALWGIKQLGYYNNNIRSTYEFNIYNSKKAKKVITYQEFCQPDNLGIQDIYESGNCVAIPLNVLKNFIHENKKFTFKFFIKANLDKPANQNANSAAPPQMLNMDDKMSAFAQKLNLN